MKVKKIWTRFSLSHLETWLSDKEQQGLCLYRISFMGFMFHFEPCAKKQTIYRIEHKKTLTLEMENQLLSYGFEYITTHLNWIIYRKIVDQQSKPLILNYEISQKTSRDSLIRAWAFMTPLWILPIIIYLLSDHQNIGWYTIVLFVIITMVFCYYLYYLLEYLTLRKVIKSKKS